MLCQATKADIASLDTTVLFDRPGLVIQGHRSLSEAIDMQSADYVQPRQNIHLESRVPVN